MESIPLSHLLDTAIDAAKTAGAHALDNKNRREETTAVFNHDVKLVMDIECQQMAEKVITAVFPDHGILGEEEARPNSATDYEWIIDPIDGTMNYTHGFPYWCCSVAVRHHDEILAGCVYAPETGDCYTAHIHEPARCNGAPLRVSNTAILSQSMIFTGLSKHMDATSGRHLEMFRTLALNTRKIRINGSAALDLCHVAAGFCDGFFETSLYLWDHAAAGLIARQAGAVLALYPEAGVPHGSAVLCANEHLIDGLRSIYTQYIPS